MEILGIELTTFLAIVIVLIVLLLIAILATLYTIVPADHADVIIQKGKMRVFSPHREYKPQGKSAYFKIPSWFFLFSLGMIVHRIPFENSGNRCALLPFLRQGQGKVPLRYRSRMSQ